MAERMQVVKAIIDQADRREHAGQVLPWNRETRGVSRHGDRGSDIAYESPTRSCLRRVPVRERATVWMAVGFGSGQRDLAAVVSDKSIGGYTNCDTARPAVSGTVRRRRTSGHACYDILKMPVDVRKSCSSWPSEANRSCMVARIRPSSGGRGWASMPRRQVGSMCFSISGDRTWGRRGAPSAMYGVSLATRRTRTWPTHACGRWHPSIV